MSHVQYVCGRAGGRMDEEMSGVPRYRGAPPERRRNLKGAGRATYSSDAPCRGLINQPPRLAVNKNVLPVASRAP